MRGMKRGIAIVTVAAMLASSFSVGSSFLKASEPSGDFMVKGSTWKYGLGEAVGFNENTYKTIAKSTTNDNWRDGSVTANGEIGFIESCDPDEDVFILNNTKIVTDGTDIYETPVISGVLDAQRKGAITRDSFPWINEVDKYASSQYGTGWGTTWPRKYQPGAQIRIKNNSFTTDNGNNYNRYTNYETGEVGVQWKDNSGNEWNRMSFASRSDDVIVTYIEAPEGQDLDLTLSLDNLVEMRNQGTTNPCPASDYVVTDDANGYAFGMVAKYPIQNRKGSKNVKETLFARGGWGSATRIVTNGTVDYQADTRDVKAPSSFGGGTQKNANDPKLNISGANSIILVTKIDRIDSGCDNVGDVKTKLYDSMVGDIDNVIAKYSVKDDLASYRKLLAPHAEIHGGMFNNVRIELCSTEDEKADRELTNTELIAKQNSDKDSLNKAFLERIYNNGRFGLMCASGYGSTRLGAIWNGAWNPDWSGDYTLDANTNLQISGMNTGNMQGASDGYVNFIIRMVEDWDDDATNIYGMQDAIKAPPRVDGTGEAGSFHFMGGYPHIYVNGITDWLILPIFEYWQCFGNQQVPVGKDVDIERDQEVLDLTDADVERITSTGYIDLEKDILYPMLKKTMNFWLQYVDSRYYTDGNGEEHADDGTTIEQAIAAGDTNCKYIYTPGYSPENSPKGDADNSNEALAYNTTMDIAASRDTLYMARTLVNDINPVDKSELLTKWADFETKIPDYLYADTGELKEWATPKLGDKHSHRHVSHAYVAWPGYDTQTDDDLRVGVIKAMDARSAAYGGQEASESHGPTHKSLVEARLKNVQGLENVLKYLLTNNYQYSSMMTSHNNNHSSTYCTDSAFGIMGALNESLLYSSDDVVEILPTLLSTADKGSISGLRARCNAQCDISWDINNWKASVTVATDEAADTVKLRCGQAWEAASVAGVPQKIMTDDDNMPYVELKLVKGTPITVDFSLADTNSRLSVSSDTDLGSRISAGSSIDFKAMYTFERTEASGVTWTIANANGTADGAAISGDGVVSVTDAMKGSTYRVSATTSKGLKSNDVLFSVAGADTFNVNAVFSDDALAVYIANDAAAKNISVILASYDAAGRYLGMVEKDCTLAAGGFSKTLLSAGWDIKSGNSVLYIWDKENNMPYVPQITIK